MRKSPKQLKANGSAAGDPSKIEREERSLLEKGDLAD